jgi:hypothetical protein
MPEYLDPYSYKYKKEMKQPGAAKKNKLEKHFRIFFEYC